MKRNLIKREENSTIITKIIQITAIQTQKTKVIIITLEELLILQ